MWSCAAKKDKGQLQLVHNRAAHIVLRCTPRMNVNNIHVSLPWLKVEERLTASLLVFVRGVDMLKVPSSWQTVQTLIGTTQEMQPELFSQSPGSEQSIK